MFHYYIAFDIAMVLGAPKQLFLFNIISKHGLCILTKYNEIIAIDSIYIFSVL